MAPGPTTPGPTAPGPTALGTQNSMVSSIHCLHRLKFAIFYFLTSIVYTAR